MLQPSLFTGVAKTLETCGLRDFQLEDAYTIITNYEFGVNTQLVVHATGLGKTKLMSCMPYILSKLGLKHKVFVIVHRQELAEQSKEEFELSNPHLKVGIEQAEKRADRDCDVVIGSVQTLGTARFDENGWPIQKARLLKIDPDEFGAVLVDETHRASAKSFRSMIIHFKCHKHMSNFDPTKLFLGFTATPDRSDNQGLEEFYETIAANRDIVWGIENKWLVRPKAWRINTHVDLDAYELKDSSGEFGKDFSKKELEKAVNTPARNRLIIEKYKELHQGYRGIFFCVDVQHAKDLCAMANSMGIKSAAVFGETDTDTRREILKDFKKGKYKALMSVGCFVEGFNDPGVVVACMCRPTKSLLFYKQAIGRVLRLFPGREKLAEMIANGEIPEWVKDCAMILDFCDTSSKHNIVTASSIFGMGSKYDFKGGDVLTESKRFQEELCKLDEEAQKKVKDVDVSSIEQLKATIEQIDLLKVPTVASELKSDLDWVKIGGSSYEISLPGSEVLRIVRGSFGLYNVNRSVKGLESIVQKNLNLDEAVKYAEKQCITDENRDLLSAEAKWKKRRPSPQQISTLLNLRKDISSRFSGPTAKDAASEWIKTNFDKGQVSLMISDAINNRQQRGNLPWTK